MDAQTVLSTQNTRLEALQKKHRILAVRVEEAYKRPSATDFYLNQLKKKKLWLKEQIEEIRRKTANA